MGSQRKAHHGWPSAKAAERRQNAERGADGMQRTIHGVAVLLEIENEEFVVAVEPREGCHLPPPELSHSSASNAGYRGCKVTVAGNIMLNTVPASFAAADTDPSFCFFHHAFRYPKAQTCANVSLGCKERSEKFRFRTSRAMPQPVSRDGDANCRADRLLDRRHGYALGCGSYRCSVGSINRVRKQVGKHLAHFPGQAGKSPGPARLPHSSSSDL